MRTNLPFRFHLLKAATVSLLLAAGNVLSANPTPLQAKWIWL